MRLSTSLSTRTHCHTHTSSIGTRNSQKRYVLALFQSLAPPSNSLWTCSEH